MGMAAILVMWPTCHKQTSVLPHSQRIDTKFGFDRPSCSEEKTEEFLCISLCKTSDP